MEGLLNKLDPHCTNITNYAVGVYLLTWEEVHYLLLVNTNVIKLYAQHTNSHLFCKKFIEKESGENTPTTNSLSLPSKIRGNFNLKFYRYFLIFL